MIIFINLGHQINNDKSERPQFAFYCTEKEGFEEVNEEYTWETIEGFKQDFLLDIERMYEDVQEYIDLIPENFGKDYNPMESLVDRLNGVFGQVEAPTQEELDQVNQWAEKYNTEREIGNWSEGRHIIPKEIVREIKE